MKAVKKTAVNVGRLFVIIIAVIIALGSAIGVTALIDSISAIKTKQVITTYTIGSLDENGQHVKGNNSLYSDLFECQGLEITQSFDSPDMYFQVYYYYENEDFAECSEVEQNGYYNPESVPEDVMYARVLIIPNDKPVVSWYNMYEYTTSLKIEVDIDQTVNYHNILDDSDVAVKYEGKKAGLNTSDNTLSIYDGSENNEFLKYSYYVISLESLGLKAGDKIKLVYHNGSEPTWDDETYRFVGAMDGEKVQTYKNVYFANSQTMTELPTKILIEVPSNSNIKYLILNVNNSDIVELNNVFER